MYEPQLQEFTTPRGHSVRMWWRDGTNDYNVLRSCLDEDEYGLANLSLSGRALDVGAHIGGVTVALLVDNPGLQVTALEAVPDNVWLLERNLAENGLTASVIHGAACGPKQSSQRIAYRYSGSVNAEHHAFIGNATLVEASAIHNVDELPCHPLSEFTPLDFLKIDCEGCEYAFLQGLALRDVAEIVGEWHPIPDHPLGRDELGIRFTEAGFRSFFNGPEGGPAGFMANRR